MADRKYSLRAQDIMTPAPEIISCAGTAADIWVCTSCGFTMDGQPPDKCPVCGVSKDKFRKF